MIDWIPSSIAIQIGPLPLYWYGIAYAVGLAGAYWVMVRQARRFGENAELLGNGLIIVGVAGLIGGRLYHVIDQWQLYANDPIRIILPPYSGLGVFGGFVTGSLAFLYLVRRYRVSAWRWADIVAPGLFVMQAVGRWGNFFNQELYGPPTSLPWGIAIDCAHRVAEYPCATFPPDATHFHPLFLYESLSAVLGAIVILWLSSRPRPSLRVGDLGAIALIWIGGVRFLLEFLRIGNWRLADIPTAQIFGAAFVVIGLGIFWLRRRQGAPMLAPVEPLDQAEDEDWPEEETSQTAELTATEPTAMEPTEPTAPTPTTKPTRPRTTKPRTTKPRTTKPRTTKPTTTKPKAKAKPTTAKAKPTTTKPRTTRRKPAPGTGPSDASRPNDPQGDEPAPDADAPPLT
jgi:phosphatidylglycerol---prolipoprotein diacylglyceryl transferase